MARRAPTRLVRFGLADETVSFASRPILPLGETRGPGLQLDCRIRAPEPDRSPGWITLAVSHRDADLREHAPDSLKQDVAPDRATQHEPWGTGGLDLRTKSLIELLELLDP
jgi:hypothetical protein